MGKTIFIQLGLFLSLALVTSVNGESPLLGKRVFELCFFGAAGGRGGVAFDIVGVGKIIYRCSVISEGKKSPSSLVSNLSPWGNTIVLPCGGR